MKTAVTGYPTFKAAFSMMCAIRWFLLWFGERRSCFFENSMWQHSTVRRNIVCLSIIKGANNFHSH